MRIVLEVINEPSLWRASIEGAGHCGGTGFDPESALGWLVFNHPERFGAGLLWKSPKPKLTPPEEYPGERAARG